MRTNTAVAINNLAAQPFEKTNSYRRSRRRWTTNLCFSGFLGLSAGVVGLIFSFESLSGVAGSQLSLFGAVLIAAMFPLLMLAAHCLDKIGQANKAIRLEYCRQNGLSDEEC